LGTEESGRHYGEVSKSAKIQLLFVFREATYIFKKMLSVAYKLMKNTIKIYQNL